MMHYASFQGGGGSPGPQLLLLLLLLLLPLTDYIQYQDGWRATLAGVPHEVPPSATHTLPGGPGTPARIRLLASRRAHTHVTRRRRSMRPSVRTYADPLQDCMTMRTRCVRPD